MTRDEEELRTYLGERFDRSRLVRWQEQLEEEARAVGDEAELYRTSEAYLYNLTAFAMTGTKLPYLEAVAAALPPGARVLDVGCGIGSDGLWLLERGFDVTFADFDNPSTRYLRWRLDRRGVRAPVVDVDAGPLPGGFDLAYAFDVLEHVPDPFSFVAALERAGRMVCVNVLETDPCESELHRALPVRALVAHAARRRLVLHHRLHGGRSHLLLYDVRPARGPRRVLSAWRAGPGARPRGRLRAGRPPSAGAGGGHRHG